MDTRMRPSPSETLSASGKRGGLQPPHIASGEGRTASLRLTLTVKLAPSDEQYDRLRELAWQAMRYKNLFLRARWAEAMQFRAAEASADKAGISKQVRAQEKMALSGCAYSAAEREVQALWQRDGARILAGAPLPQFRQAESLSIRGHKDRAQSGVRIAIEGDGFVAELLAQAQACDGGCWLRVPIAKGTETDTYQAPLLRAMAAGEVPIDKGTVVFRFARHRCYLKLSYEQHRVLPPLGARIATLGPLTRPGERLLLRTETQTIDHTGRLTTLLARKTQWDLIRRRVFAQIGRRRGSARKKRVALARLGFDRWMTTFLHSWSREIVEWCHSQGVGELVVVGLTGGDWPAHRLITLLEYKAHELGIVLRREDAATLAPASTARAAKSAVERARRKARRLGEAVRELSHQLT